MRETPKQGDELGLTENELAFYDAWQTTQSGAVLTPRTRVSREARPR